MPTSTMSEAKRHLRRTRGRSAAGLLAAAAICTSPLASAWQPPPKPPPLRLDDSTSLPLLAPFRHAAGIPASSLHRYLDGPYGQWRTVPWRALSWQLGEPLLKEEPPAFEPTAAQDEALPVLAWTLDERPMDTVPGRLGCSGEGVCVLAEGLLAEPWAPSWTALAPTAAPVPAWKCKPRKVTIGRFGRETDSFELVRCDGSVAPDAIDRLALIARPPGIDRPGELLPDEPDVSAPRGEWLPGIRMMDPRLLWALQAVANAFPYRAIYVYSGYRQAPSSLPPGGRASYHWQGRAIDIHVYGIANEALFKVCHALDDVGCGFYPNRPFVHLDVRPFGHGHVCWVDTAGMGERAKYVDSWPGVIESGAMAWGPAGD
jgi:hypothetical protein